MILEYSTPVSVWDAPNFRILGSIPDDTIAALPESTMARWLHALSGCNGCNVQVQARQQLCRVVITSHTQKNKQTRDEEPSGVRSAWGDRGVFETAL